MGTDKVLWNYYSTKGWFQYLEKVWTTNTLISTPDSSAIFSPSELVLSCLLVSVSLSLSRKSQLYSEETSEQWAVTAASCLSEGVLSPDNWERYGGGALLLYCITETFERKPVTKEVIGRKGDWRTADWEITSRNIKILNQLSTEPVVVVTTCCPVWRVIIVMTATLWVGQPCHIVTVVGLTIDIHLGLESLWKIHHLRDPLRCRRCLASN